MSTPVPRGALERAGEDDAIHHFGAQKVVALHLPVPGCPPVLQKTTPYPSQVDGVLDAAHDLREIGVGDVRQQNADDLALARLEPPGKDLSLGCMIVFGDSAAALSPGGLADVLGHTR